MSPSRLSWLAYGLASALLGPVSAVQLEPIDMLANGAKMVTRDHDYTKLDLLNAETFLWGGMYTRSDTPDMKKLTSSRYVQVSVERANTPLVISRPICPASTRVLSPWKSSIHC